MRPCPECGSSDRQEDEDTYALVKVKAGTIKLDTTPAKPTLEGYICRLLVCNSCGHVAMTTAPE